jgi:nitrile hydratase subunit beta
MSDVAGGYHSNADLGGQDGYGAVRPEPEGDVFRAAWEARVLALTLAMGATGLWNIDSSRAARETLVDYGKLTYYQIWLAGLEKLLVQSGAVRGDEIAQGRSMQVASAVSVLRADRVAAVLARGAPTVRTPGGPPRYAVGQWVRTSMIAPPHHTRLPGYARGKRGVIERSHGAHVFADSHAQGLGERPQWLYTVVFDEKELWSATPLRQRSAVSVDAWESYLDPA